MLLKVPSWLSDVAEAEELAKAANKRQIAEAVAKVQAGLDLVLAATPEAAGAAVQNLLPLIKGLVAVVDLPAATPAPTPATGTKTPEQMVYEAAWYWTRRQPQCAGIKPAECWKKHPELKAQGEALYLAGKIDRYGR